MTREIKFRAWDKENRRMRPHEELYFDCGEFKNPTLMQYTGLKDKNGVEVYESDIVKYQMGEQGKEDSFYEERKQVYNIRGGFVICGRNAQNFNVLDDMTTIRNIMWCSQGSYTVPDIYYEIREVEVIGNIYANPDLLTTT